MGAGVFCLAARTLLCIYSTVCCVVLFCGFYDVLGGSVILLCLCKYILNIWCFYAFTRVFFLVGLVYCYLFFRVLL